MWYQGIQLQRLRCRPRSEESTIRHTLIPLAKDVLSTSLLPACMDCEEPTLSLHLQSTGLSFASELKEHIEEAYSLSALLPHFTIFDATLCVDAIEEE